MSALEHRFDTPETQATQPEVDQENEAPEISTGLLSGMSLTRKLNLAVFGNTIILAVIAGLILYGTNYFGERGFFQAVLTSIEVRTNNAAIALNDVDDDLEVVLASDSAAERQSALSEATASLEFAQAAVSDPISFGGDLMPQAEGELLADFLVRVEAAQAALAEAGTDPQAIAQVQGDAFEDPAKWAMTWRAWKRKQGAGEQGARGVA